MKRRIKKKYKIIGIIIILLILIILGLIIWFSIDKDNNVDNTKPQIKDNMENYDYYLNDNTTDYYESLYKELKVILNEETIDDSKFASAIAKLFITDVFTLDNKITSNDIGGLQFIHSDFKDDFISIAKTSLYSNVESNIYGDRKQELPIVSNVEITKITSSTFKYKNVSNDSYDVSATITYEKDLGYPTNYKLTLIKNNNHWQVVSGN